MLLNFTQTRPTDLEFQMQVHYYTFHARGIMMHYSKNEKTATAFKWHL